MASVSNSKSALHSRENIAAQIVLYFSLCAHKASALRFLPFTRGFLWNDCVKIPRPIECREWRRRCLIKGTFPRPLTGLLFHQVPPITSPSVDLIVRFMVLLLPSHICSIQVHTCSYLSNHCCSSTWFFYNRVSDLLNLLSQDTLKLFLY